MPLYDQNGRGLERGGGVSCLSVRSLSQPAVNCSGVGNQFLLTRLCIKNEFSLQLLNSSHL